MKITNGIIAALLIMSFGIYESAADGTSEGTISRIYTQKNIAFFNAGVQVNHASCSGFNEWAVDISTPTGTAMYAMLLTAKSLNAVLNVRGTGVCDVWGDRETVRYMSFQ